MKPKRTVLLILCLPLLGIYAKLDTKEYLTYKGIATDLLSNKFYYVEEHREIIDEQVLKQTVIQYKDAKGKVIARKIIDYSGNKVAPSFEQYDYRDGYNEAVSYQNNKLVLTCRKNNLEKEKTKTIAIPENLVVDGGFNYYIKGNWNKLINGETLAFNFAVPSQLDYFSFRLYKEKDENEQVIFKMEPDNFVLRKLVDPIHVTYNSSSKRIVKYEGLSNINNDEGKSYLVKIMYPKVGP